MSSVLIGPKMFVSASTTGVHKSVGPRLAEPGRLIVVSAVQIIAEDLLRDPSALFRLTPRTFPDFVAELLERGGYAVQPVRESVYAKDGGIDLIAWRKDQPMLPVLIGVQCKHHGSDGYKTVVGDVQRLIAYRADGPFHLGLMVTNTDFTQDARFAAEHQGGRFINLRNGEDLRRWAKGDYSMEGRELPREIALAPGVTVRLAVETPKPELG